MTLRTFIFRSLRFHARSHLGVMIGAAIATAALTGALLVGDSMRASLRQRALGRLGWVRFAMAPQDRFFSTNLLNNFVPGAAIPPEFASIALSLPGTAARGDGSARANNVKILGVDDNFWRFPTIFRDIPSNSVVLSAALAAQLHVRRGDEVLLRCRKPSAMSREMAVTPHNEETIAFRLQVHVVAEPESMGDFTLRSEQTPALNAFMRLDELGAKLDLKDKANLLLAGSIYESEARARRSFMLDRVHGWLWLHQSGLAQRFGISRSLSRRNRKPEEVVELLNEGLRHVSSIESLGVQLRDLPEQHALELRSGQIFLEPELVRTADAINQPPEPVSSRFKILTLLANRISFGSNSTPYSMVTAAGPPYTPPDLKDNEIVLSQWLADDLQAQRGGEISLDCFDPESGARLIERTNTFRVHSIVPFEMPWADRTLMPNFPGIDKAESTADWDAGFPLVYKIRPKDEDYWKKFKGTPKAFITLAAGQKMWGNRFGNLTAIRFGIPPTFSAEQYRQILERKLMTTLNLSALGLRFEAVREQALTAASQSQDFGQLFLGFSFFLVVAALLLMALLFQFGLERRTAEIGILLALGFTPSRVRRVLLLEGTALAFVGGIVGALGGALYAKQMLTGLSTIWSRAVGAIPLHFAAASGTLMIGIASSVVVAVGALWLTLRKQAKQPARELLAQSSGSHQFALRRTRGWTRWISIFSALAAIGTVVWACATGNRVNAEAFFSAGCLMLIAGLTAAAAWLRSLGFSTSLTLSTLAIRACARRTKRSLTTIALLASGVFLIVAIGVFRLDANRDALKPSSGTGGFALMGQSTLAVVQDLNSREGAQAFGIDQKVLQNIRIVGFRVHEGDEASCLNLDRAQKPRVLGVKPESLVGHFTFSSRRGSEADSAWRLLAQNSLPQQVAAVVDANSLEWALHKKVGDTIDYLDERGRPFKLLIVGAVANSILQGSLIIDESEFIKRFPGDTGYRMFLIEAPSNRVTQVSQQLSRALQDVGLELTSTVTRLNTFNAVQNTYLSTFQVLGGLGLLLGSAGLAIVVLRNVLERRGELGLLTAVGFSHRALQQLILLEHGALLASGLAMGIIAAVIAVLPALLSPGRSLPYASLGVTLAAVIANGLLWTWISTRAALGGNLLQALRNE